MTSGGFFYPFFQFIYQALLGFTQLPPLEQAIGLSLATVGFLGLMWVLKPKMEIEK